MFTSSGDYEEHFSSRDHNFVNMFTQQKCLCCTDKSLSSNVMEGIRDLGHLGMLASGGGPSEWHSGNAKGDVKFT